MGMLAAAAVFPAQAQVKATFQSPGSPGDKTKDAKTGQKSSAGPSSGFLGSHGQGPINVEADNGIEWQQARKAYIARGNAKATRGEVTLYADTLTAYYREMKDSQATEIWRVVADGHVRIVRPTETITGEHGIYDIDQAVVVLTGKNLKLTTPQDVVTARDSLEWYDQRQLAVARGDALGVRDDRRIRADVLSANVVNAKDDPPPVQGHKPVGQQTAGLPKTPAKPAALGPDGKPVSDQGSRISRIDGSGHVVITSESDSGINQVGSGDKGVYDLDTGIATLIGHVTLARGNNSLVGEYGVMDLNSGVSRLLPRRPVSPGGPHGRVQGYVVPERDDDQETADAH